MLHTLKDYPGISILLVKMGISFKFSSRLPIGAMKCYSAGDDHINTTI